VVLRLVIRGARTWIWATSIKATSRGTEGGWERAEELCVLFRHCHCLPPLPAD
jgi:hypothetical protein